MELLAEYRMAVKQTVHQCHSFLALCPELGRGNAGTKYQKLLLQ
jgi:hypothetical protein